MKSVSFAWNELDSRLDQPLPSEAESIALSARSFPVVEVDLPETSSVAAVIELSTPEAELLGKLPVAVILAAIPEPRLAQVSVVLPVTGKTLRDVLGSQQSVTIPHQLRESGPSGAEDVWPALSPQAGRPLSGWRKSLLAQILETCPTGNRVGRLAFEAGILLLHDDLDASHRCSQAIEGEGRHHPGDYWHAILHRREPDDSNAKYWFRHVGEHPIFADLLSETATCAAGSSSPEFRRWAAEQSAKSTWDPYAFVDVCSRAERATDPHFRQSCQQLQYREMLRLLVWTWRFAMSESP